MSGLTGAFVYPAPHAIRRRHGSDVFFTESRLAGLTKAFAFAVVFIGGWYLCLPMSDIVAIPWWAKQVAIGPNILVHEALFAVYLTLGGIRPIVRSAARASYTTLFASVCLAILAVWCAIASLLAPFPLHDAGRSARLILLALMLLGVTHWSASDPLFVLRSFLFGLTGGTLVNLTFTFLNPIVAGVLPRLLGQNSPGPPMGIAVCLASWLILLSRNRRDSIIGISAAVLCGVGAMISYSKTGMLAAAMGFLSLVVVSGRVAGSKRGRILLASLFGLLFFAASYFGSEAGQRVWNGFSGMLEEKVVSASSESNSVQERWSYVNGVSEIVLKHPLGVGYSGFRDAMMHTEAYDSGLAADESANSADDSNPHSLFLYYTSAGGILGGLLVITIFVSLCRVLVDGLGLYGIAGVLVALGCVVAYLILAISVPYVFNSGVMLIPAGLAAGLRAHVLNAGGDR